MKWSKLKQRVEANFVPELQERVQLRLVAYRQSHDQPQRGTIVVDGIEWAEFCTIQYEMARYERGRTVGDDVVQDQMKVEMFQPGWLFTAACFSFLNMSIEDAVASDDPLHRLLAVLDKRVGKRRLLKIRENYLEPELLEKFYQLRVDATYGKTI